MANDKNYNTLRDAWVKWRDVSGKTMREDYKQYVELENKAAVLNGKNPDKIWTRKDGMEMERMDGKYGLGEK